MASPPQQFDTGTACLLTAFAVGLGLIGEGPWGVAAVYSLFLGAVMLSSWIRGPRS